MSPSPRSPDPEAFWLFAATAWDRADVRERLLRWQEKHGIDVIFLLFACWLSRPLPPQRWTQLRTGADPWHIAVTRRIRVLRRRIRQLDWPQGHQSALALELASERLEATWLAHAAGKPRGQMTVPNLELRIGRLFPDLQPAERNDFLAAIRRLL